jgi:hypothetical protein
MFYRRLEQKLGVSPLHSDWDLARAVLGCLQRSDFAGTRKRVAQAINLASVLF